MLMAFEEGSEAGGSLGRLLMVRSKSERLGNRALLSHAVRVPRSSQTHRVSLKTPTSLCTSQICVTPSTLAEGTLSSPCKPFSPSFSPRVPAAQVGQRHVCRVLIYTPWQWGHGTRVSGN